MKILYSILIYIIVGPMIGCILYFGYININKKPIEWHNLLYVFTIFSSELIILFAYALGAAPALASGILYQYPIHAINSIHIRIWSAILIGAASNLIWMNYVIPGAMLLYGDSLSNVGFLGAAASFLCACLIEWIGRHAGR